VKTYKEFLKESKLRQLTLGPSSSRFGRARQQKDASERAAFRRSGMRRSRPGSRRIGFKGTFGDYNRSTITTYPNQSSYAKDKMPPKIDNKSGKVVRTKQRVLFLKRLKRQTGNRSNRKVHEVDILPRQDFKKNDPDKLITRGKEYHSTVRDIPKNVKDVAKGKPGDIISGKASEVMPGSKDIKKGRKNRENLYSRVLGASKRDPITNIQAARVKE